VTIRAKLGGGTALLLLLVIGLIATAFYVGEKSFLERRLDAAHQDVLSHFAQTCRDAYLLRDDLALLNAVQGLSGNEWVADAYFADPRGRLLAHTDAAFIGRSLGELPSPRGALRERRRAVAVQGQGDALAVIRVDQQKIQRSVDEAAGQVFRRLAGVLAGAFLLGVAGAWALAKHLTDPVRRIAQGTHGIAQGRLETRLDVRNRDELGLLAKDFNLMAERLGELDRMKKEFVSNVTHELRSPLGAIESYANLMMDDVRAGRPSDLLGFLTIIRNNSARLGRFINDLLDLSRLEQKKAVLEPVDVALAELLNDVGDLFRSQAREKGVGLECASPPGDWTLRADPDKLTQVMNNLVGNALKFTSSGGRVVVSAERLETTETLRTSLRSAGAAEDSVYYRIRVADTGRGIAPEDLGRIFERFEQVRHANSSSGPRGTGLGLAICQGWVRAHGGVIQVESAPGRGSVFSVTLPRGGVA
jgi:signal transduction histidine kinase